MGKDRLSKEGRRQKQKSREKVYCGVNCVGYIGVLVENLYTVRKRII